MDGSLTNASLDLLPAPLRAALARREFDSLTSVQEAVLDPDCKGRDLRISSQTGSGKTIALGIAAFEALTTALESDSKQPEGPLMLVIVPTRELAAQVGAELESLYSELEGLRTDCVTGGTSVFGERQRLTRPPHVLVGTPGRLVDHVEAGALRLSEVRELVLDEADQMLDLGFRDELESLLAAMPGDQRTHLVSATFPDGIRQLAERFQPDARTVQGTAAGEANADIEHRAYRVDAQDRYAALVNLLLIEPEERTLIFVATRAGAGQLADRLAEDGFAALPLSGDLAQAQRTRTLAAFRTGVARILVATDVAARGLDVSDVSRVVHASPAMDGEVFTHRSGRTGRAGRKGTSILLVTPRQERKIGYQLRDARVEVEWHATPDADDVREAQRERQRAELEAAVAELESAEDVSLERARQLLEGRSAEHVVAALLDRAERQDGPQPQDLNRRLETEPRTGGDSGGKWRDKELRPARRSGPRRDENVVRYQINWGLEASANPKRILAHVCRRTGIEGRAVGAIRIQPRSSTFEIEAGLAEDFDQRIVAPDERDPRIKIRRAWANSGDDNDRGGERRWGGHRDDRAERPGHRPFRPGGSRPAYDHGRRDEGRRWTSRRWASRRWTSRRRPTLRASGAPE
jgi:ATP-dependent RNA helicase DeaD